MSVFSRNVFATYSTMYASALELLSCLSNVMIILFTLLF